MFTEISNSNQQPDTTINAFAQALLPGEDQSSPKQGHPGASAIAQETLEQARYVTRLAFVDRNSGALDVCHRVIHRLIGARFGLHIADGDRDPVRFAVEQILIDGLVNDYEVDLVKTPAPESPEEFVKWWHASLHPFMECPHELFRFIADKGSADDIRSYLEQDLGVHVRFDDVVASLMIGSREGARTEIVENLHDEFGSGGDNDSHMDMLLDVSDAFSLAVHPTDNTIWQALSCANCLMILSHYRSLYPEAVGYFGCLEALTPGRFKRLIEGGERAGLSDKALKFYREHAEADGGHADGWLYNVIVPLIRENPETARRVRRGMLLRLGVSDDFWRTILNRCQSS